MCKPTGSTTQSLKSQAQALKLHLPVWATLVVLTHIRKNFASMAWMWNMAGRKAARHLAKQTRWVLIEDDTDVQKPGDVALVLDSLL